MLTIKTRFKILEFLINFFCGERSFLIISCPTIIILGRKYKSSRFTIDEIVRIKEMLKNYI